MKRKTRRSFQACEYYWYNTGYDGGYIESTLLWVVPNAQVYK